MTDRLDEKIRAFVAELVNDPPAAPEIDFEGVESPGVAALHQSPSRPRWVPAVVAAGAAFAVLIAVGIPILVLGGGDSIVADEPATTTPTTVPTATTSTVAPVAAAMSWRRVPGDGVLADSSVSAVVAGGPGLIAGGVVFDPDRYLEAYLDGVPLPPGRAALWVSEDGTAWERIDDSMLFADDGIGADSVIVDVAAGPLGVIAVGAQGYDAAIWISPDGRSWTRVVDDDLVGDGLHAVVGVTPGGPGWVAVGDGDFDALVWVSSDGLDWTLVEDEDLLGGDMVHADLYDVTLAVPGVVAVGSVGFTDGTGDAAQRAAIWISETGFDWQRLRESSFEGARVFEGVGSDPDSSRLVAFGTPEGTWHSNDDGREWIKVEQSADLGGPAPSSGVAWDGDQLVAAGRDLAFSVWVSLDGGLSWHRIEPEPGTFDARDVAYDVALDGSQLIAVGEAAARPGEPPEGVVWIGEWTNR